MLFAASCEIVDHLLRPAHGAERDVHAAEDLVPMPHRLCREHFVKNGGELSHIRHQLRRIGEAELPVRRSGRPIAFATAAILSGETMSTNQVHVGADTR